MFLTQNNKIYTTWRNDLWEGFQAVPCASAPLPPARWLGGKIPARLWFETISFAARHPDRRVVVTLYYRASDQHWHAWPMPQHSASTAAHNEPWQHKDRAALLDGLAQAGYARYGSITSFGHAAPEQAQLAETTRVPGLHVHIGLVHAQNIAVKAFVTQHVPDLAIGTDITIPGGFLPASADLSDWFEAPEWLSVLEGGLRAKAMLLSLGAVEKGGYPDEWDRMLLTAPHVHQAVIPAGTQPVADTFDARERKELKAADAFPDWEPHSGGGIPDPGAWPEESSGQYGGQPADPRLNDGVSLYTSVDQVDWPSCPKLQHDLAGKKSVKLGVAICSRYLEQCAKGIYPWPRFISEAERVPL